MGRRLLKKRSSLRKIKKDIMRCNFPTKVKFLGLTEKKVMFLTKTFTIDTPLNEQPNQIPDWVPAANENPNKRQAYFNSVGFYLEPLDSDNVQSILSTLVNIAGQQDGTLSNWDKLCILGVYIKFQPKKNTWAASDAANNISQVKCTYNMNNVPVLAKAAIDFDMQNLPNKQVFTFNSNEAFTIYVPAPTTMSTNSPCVHKSKTWWSITDLGISGSEILRQRTMEEDDDDESGDEPNLGAPFGARPVLHAGRIFLQGENIHYNVTINYKVALKG